MGRGRGRQVVSVAKTADVIIIMSKHRYRSGIETRPLTADESRILSGCHQVE